VSINAAKAKDINRLRVLNSIRKNSGLSRQEIAESIGLSAPAVGNIVTELIAEGLVRELGRRSKQRGQPAKELEFCADGAYAMGLFLELNEVSAVVVNLNGDIQEQKQVSLSQELSPDEAVSILLELVEALLSPSYKEKLLGIGLATFGPLNLEKGTINAPQRSNAWVNVPLRDQIAEKTQYTVYLDNDATAAAIGEHWYGAGQIYPNYLYIHMTDGLGGGLFLNGEVYRGGSLNAAEFGHMLIKHNGRIQYLEEIVSLKAFAKKLDIKPSIAEFERLFKQADASLLACLDEAAEILAQSIVSVDHLLDLDAIILGGHLSEAFLQYLLDKTQLHCEPLFMRGKPSHTELILGYTGQHSAVLGAATLPLYDAFIQPARISSAEHVFSSTQEDIA